MKFRDLVHWGTFLLIGSATPAVAASNEPCLYDPPRVLTANPIAEGTLAIDVLGIVPGMTPEQLEPLVRKTFGDMWFMKSKNALMASRNSIYVRSSDYVSGISGTRYDKGTEFSDRIDIAMSGVAGGNQAIGLSRNTCYGDGIERPFLVDVIKSLTDKYGSPSLTLSGRIEWAYRDGGKIDLPKTARLLSDFNRYDGNGLRYYPDVDEPWSYRIEAQFDLDARDKTRIRCLEINAGSNKLRREAAKADLEVLNRQLDNAVTSHPHVAGPAL